MSLFASKPPPAKELAKAVTPEYLTELLTEVLSTHPEWAEVVFTAAQTGVMNAVNKSGLGSMFDQLEELFK